MRFLLLSLLFVASSLTAFPALASCPEPATRADVALPAVESMKAFGMADAAGFEAVSKRAISQIPCLSELLLPAEVAKVHGMMALVAFRGNGEGEAVNAFRSALSADPSFQLPGEIIEGHLVRVRLEVASGLVESKHRPLPDLAPDQVMVNGVVADKCPADRPALLQRIASDGRVLESVYVSGRDPLPSWTAPQPIDLKPLPTASPASHKRPYLLAGATGVALLTSGISYGFAAQAHGQFLKDPGAYPDEASALRDRANGLTWASIGSGVIALGLGTVTVVRW